MEIRGHLDPDLSPRGGTAARSFAPDSARVGPRFESNPPNSFSSAPHDSSGSLNRSGDRKPWNFKEPVKSGVVSHSRGKTCGKFTLGLPKRTMILTKCPCCAAPLPTTSAKQCSRCKTRYCGPACQVSTGKRVVMTSCVRRLGKAAAPSSIMPIRLRARVVLGGAGEDCV